MITALKETAVVGANGRIEIPHSDFAEGQAVEVIVLMAAVAEEEGDAAWERIINDPRPRPKFDAFVKAAMAEGGEEPLDLDRL
jgi:hypothetical protein